MVSPGGSARGASVPDGGISGGEERVLSLDRLLLLLVVFNAADVWTSLLDHFVGEGIATLPVTALWLMLYLWAVTGLLFADGLRWVAWLLRYRLVLLVLLGGVFASLLWSIDPSLTLRRSIHLIGTTLLAFYLGYRIPYRALLRVLAGGLSLLLLLSVLAALLLPELGQQMYEGQLVWKGLFTDKNSLGFSAAIAVLVLVVLMAEARSIQQVGLYGVAIGVALVALLGSHSATSLVAMVGGVGAMALFLALKRMGVGGFAAAVLMLLSVSIVALLMAGIDLSSLFSLLGRSSDLTGREEIWESVKALLAQRPWTGTGYGTIWYPTADSQWQQDLLNLTWLAHHAHNGFYQVSSQLGIPLAVLAAFFFLQMIVEVAAIYFRAPVSKLPLFAIGFQLAYLVSNNTEAYYLVDRSLFWILQVAVPVALLRWAEYLDQSPAPVMQESSRTTDPTTRAFPFQTAGPAAGG